MPRGMKACWEDADPQPQQMDARQRVFCTFSLLPRTVRLSSSVTKSINQLGKPLSKTEAAVYRQLRKSLLV